jgi:hypothetical protein
MAATIICEGCGANIPDVDGATHNYMLSAPGCWQLYGEVLAREYSNVSYMKVHQLTVDAYAIQHPGKPERRTKQSVGLHLMSLYQTQVNSLKPHEATAFLQKAAQAAIEFTWLKPPARMGQITVVDVHAANSAEAHQQVVQAWAASAWKAWSAHHETIIQWVEQVNNQ